MNVLSKETQHLIVEAQSNYRNLLNLEGKLASLHEFISTGVGSVRITVVC